MEQVEDGKASSIEESSRELRLVEQSFFRDILNAVHGRYRRLLTWVVVIFAVATVAWTFVACPLLHHRIGWCPMGHRGT
ncbi:MAG: hypothetical protein HY352_02175 [Candidatus Omnitrophica bacterium]|nr:hypothetical protein [Candidatus Omnitrophota bacterium]